MHSSLSGGPFGPLLAWIGLFSLVYWGWRAYAAYQAKHHVAAAHGAAASPKAVASGAADADIAVIAAAVWTMLGGAHRIVHLEPSQSGQTWAVEGRWMHQTSHTTR